MCNEINIESLNLTKFQSVGCGVDVVLMWCMALCTADCLEQFKLDDIPHY